MSTPSTRYRVTITPVQAGGLPCTGRCSIEFECADGHDWMRRVEQAQRLSGLAGDERTALAVGVSLLDFLARRPALRQELADLQPGLARLLARLER